MTIHGGTPPSYPSCTKPRALPPLEPSDYARLYEASSRDPERFWSERGRLLEWIKPYSRVRDISYGPGEVHIR